MKAILPRTIVPLFLVLVFFPLALRAEPEWIWSQKQAVAGEKEIFRKAFTITGEIKSAQLALTCDNGATASLNGKMVLENRDWMEPARADVAKALRSGENELVIEGRNITGSAALLASLKIETGDGKHQLVETGPEWAAAKPGTTDFKPVVVIAKYGSGPWGKVLDEPAKKGGARAATAAATQVAADPATLQVPAGFKVELLYTVPKETQGSWVGITVDAKGRLITCDQYGAIYRVTLGQPGEAPKVEPLAVPIGGAHGVLFAHDSLYVMVDERAAQHPREQGLWRLKYRAPDDAYDEPVLLRAFKGSGEHGPHSIALGPDGKSLYASNGNHTKLPDILEKSRPVAWDEDQIIPRLWDANGHAKGILAPGGCVLKTDLEGKEFELFSMGFRNEFDIAFDANGELFTFDADMEWDIGSPWYRPTRINHVTSGGDAGWRSGAGKWPTYYPDSLPPVVNIGPGSPTGTVFGTGAKFPAKYQRAMFALDWTYGTMWAIHLTPDGASFRGEKEEFIAGKALPLTDAIIRPQDGAMYFTVGGRKTQSALYRVTYEGRESTAPAPHVPPTAEATLRHNLEKLHDAGTGLEAIEKAWPHLASKDRFVRFAARVAIERQPVEKWADRALAEKDPVALVEALVALSHVGRSEKAAAASRATAQDKSGLSSNAVLPVLPEDEARQKSVLAALGRLDFKQLAGDQRLALLRTYELAFTRFGKPAPEVCAQVAAKLDPLFPHPDPYVNRELVNLLTFVDSPTIVAKTVPLLDTARDEGGELASNSVLARNEGYARAVASMHESRPNRQAIAYAYALRHARAGWTPALRQAFFAWFPRTHAWKGGNSFTKFIENIRTEAIANFVPEGERVALGDMSKQAPPAFPANLVAPKGPGKNYSVDDVVALAKDGLKGRNFEQGKAMFSSTLCINCHHFNGEGGNSGPDITGAGSRYTLRDLLENIIEPSKVISDQYPTEQIQTKDGGLIVGRVVVEENGKLFVMTSALAPDSLTPVEEATVKSRAPYPVSMMPPGLINGLNAEELLDLLAYVQTGGNANDKAFAK